MLRQLPTAPGRQHGEPVSPTLTTPHHDLAPPEIDVLHPQRQRLARGHHGHAPRLLHSYDPTRPHEAAHPRHVRLLGVPAIMPQPDRPPYQREQLGPRLHALPYPRPLHHPYHAIARGIISA